MKNIIKGILLLGCCTQLSYAGGESDIEQGQQKLSSQQPSLQQLNSQNIPQRNDGETQRVHDEYVVIDPSDLSSTQDTQMQSNGLEQEGTEVLPPQQQVQIQQWSVLNPFTWPLFGSGNQPPQIQQQQSLPSSQHQTQTQQWSLWSPATWLGSGNQPPQIQQHQEDLQEEFDEIKFGNMETEQQVQQIISNPPSRDPELDSEQQLDNETQLLPALAGSS